MASICLCWMMTHVWCAPPVFHRHLCFSSCFSLHHEVKFNWHTTSMTRCMFHLYHIPNFPKISKLLHPYLYEILQVTFLQLDVFPLLLKWNLIDMRQARQDFIYHILNFSQILILIDRFQKYFIPICMRFCRWWGYSSLITSVMITKFDNDDSICR